MLTSLRSYVDALFYSIDGNFRQSLRAKPMDKNDVPMTEGAAYFSNNKDFNQYLDDMGTPDVEVCLFDCEWLPTKLMRTVGFVVPQVRSDGLHRTHRKGLGHRRPCMSSHGHDGTRYRRLDEGGTVSTTPTPFCVHV